MFRLIVRGCGGMGYIVTIPADNIQWKLKELAREVALGEVVEFTVERVD